MPPSTSTKKLIAPLLWALALLVALLYLVAGLPLRRARKEWRAGNVEAAIIALGSWPRLHIRAADYDEMLAVCYLTVGQSDAAREPLGRMARRDAEWFPILRKVEVARELVGRGRYGEFLQYDTAVHQHRESGELPLYRAAAQLGTNRLAESETTFATVDPGAVDPARYKTLKGAIDQRKQGSFPLILDRNGQVIAIYQVSNGDVVATNVDFAPLIDREGGALTFESNLKKIGTSATIETTLDPFMQRAALAALGSYRASMVVIDTRSNEILAVANSAGTGPHTNLAFDGTYEPGSVIKVLTGLNAIDSHVDLAKFFPLNCPGFLVLNGRQFFDWAKHDTVGDLDEAMAVSCNVSFGMLGIRIGAPKVIEFLHKAGFDDTADVGFTRVPLGKIVGKLNNAYEIASAADGLQHETINALHVATLSSMVANAGILQTPRLIRGRRTVLGERFGDFPVSAGVRIASPEAVAAMTRAMEAVVTNPRGTGRRVEVAGLPIAVKTGTAGDASPRYNCLILAFAPSHAPRLAIGLIAENAGPAEFAGAKIAHDFFERVKGKIQ
ncbi:MAG TPA: penicillin-binding transpeptidase domain-containing protein [Thermoanaerobaculia bacterium]|nr:penicillin-binding transpeptidase domain-containing protein [Thermoanaerobaculia bacterium]